MTTFYSFPSRAEFETFEQPKSMDYTRPDGIAISVIGDHNVDGVYKGYLVNATDLIEEWLDYVVEPSQPLRIFV